MATPDRAEIGHKLRQHDNEFEAVYDMIVRVDGKVDALSARMDARFDALTTSVDARFEQVDARFEQVDARFDHMDARFDHMDARFDHMEGRFREIIDILSGLRRDAPRPPGA
jgi:hypothetical protein